MKPAKPRTVTLDVRGPRDDELIAASFCTDGTVVVSIPGVTITKTLRPGDRLLIRALP